jgi:hypothetical protein
MRRQAPCAPVVVSGETRLAEGLQGRGQPADRGALDRLLNEVEDEARSMGMQAALARLQRLRDATPSRSQTDNVWRLDGDVRTLRFGGHTVVVPDAKGLHDVRALLAQPGTQISAAQLLNPFDAEQALATRRTSADAVLDRQARDAYRSRLDELEEQIAAHYPDTMTTVPIRWI